MDCELAAARIALKARSYTTCLVRCDGLPDLCGASQERWHQDEFAVETVAGAQTAQKTHVCVRGAAIQHSLLKCRLQLSSHGF